MHAFLHFLAGIFVIHVAWAYFFLWGTALRLKRSRPATNEEALLAIVLATTSGMAIVGLGTFVLGLLGLIRPLTPLVALAVLLIAFAWLGESPFRAAFWSRRAGLFIAAYSPGALFIWAYGVFRAVPAIIPDTGSDATVYYSVYAFEWAHAHGLTVDYWLRAPWYPVNWVLIETWWFALHIDKYVEFLDPLAGLLTMLATYGFTCWAARRANAWNAIIVPIVAVIAAGIFEGSPVYLHWEGIPMIDVPAALFFTAGCVAGIHSILERDRGQVADVVLCAAFLAGIKISYPALLPLFGVLIWIAIKAAGGKTRYAASSIALLLVLSSPWYLRDFILTGDPITPLLNVKLHGVDPKFSGVDVEAQESDLRLDNSPGNLLRLPLGIFLEPESRDYRDWGAPLLLSLVWLPGAVAAYLLMRRSKSQSAMLLTAACLLYADVYWMATSHTIRYAEMFLPLLASLVALAAIISLRRTTYLRYSGIFVMALCAVPSPGSAVWYTIVWREVYMHIGDYYQGRINWLELRSPAYQQMEYLSSVIHESRREDLRVYTSLNGIPNLFYREHGILVIGDVFGPERISDLARAILNDDVQSWLERLHVGAMMLDVDMYDREPVFSILPSELAALGWREHRFPDSAFKNYTVYLSPALQGVPADGVLTAPIIR